MIGILGLTIGCIPLGAWERLSDTGSVGQPDDTYDSQDTNDTYDTEQGFTTEPADGFGLSKMFGWHLVFDGNFFLSREFFGSNDEEFDTFLLPNTDSWSFAFSLAPQNSSVRDWMFGADGEDFGTEFALFSTDNALVSMQFLEDSGDNNTQRFIYPLLRYTLFDEGGAVCYTKQVSLDIRGQGYLPTVNDLQDGMQFVVGIVSHPSGSMDDEVHHDLALSMRATSTQLGNLYVAQDFLDGMSDSCSQSALAGTTRINGFKFGRGQNLILDDFSAAVDNLMGRVDDLMIFNTMNDPFDMGPLTQASNSPNSNGMHYQNLDLSTGIPDDGFGWWGFEKYVHNGAGGPGTEFKNAVDMSSVQDLNNNLMEFCFTDGDSENCLNEPEDDDNEKAKSMYRNYENGEWSEDTW